MRTYFKKVFQRSPAKLKEMLISRSKGLSLLPLGRKYGVDHTTILYHVKQSGIETTHIKKEQMILIKNYCSKFKENPIPMIHKGAALSFKYQDIVDRPVHRGNSYKEILAKHKESKRTRIDVMVGL